MSTTATTPDAASGEESFASIYAAEEQARASFSEGSVIEAMVVGIEDKTVVVDSGLKSHSRIPLEEFLTDEGEIAIKESDFVKVKLEYSDDGRGNTRLSHLQYRREKAWKEIEDAFANQTRIEGVIKERIKGGYSVHVGSLRAFLPGSLVDVFPLKSEQSLVGRREQFYVERLKPDRHSAILNRRMVREHELTSGDLASLPFKEGDVVAGVVVAVNDYPDHKAYVRLAEGVHGVLSREDYSWHRIGPLSEELQDDAELQVKVLEINIEKRLIRLGAKQLVPDPWDDMEKNYPPGTKTFAKVVSLKEYGAFVELEKGIEGLVHVSEMDWLHRSADPSKHLEPGQHVEVMMLNLDKAARRISLGLKQCRPNPWEEFSVSFKKGTRLQGKIVGIQDNLGMFVEMPGGINGLAHLSNLSYSDTDGRGTLAKYNVGDEVEVMVIEVDVEKQRIALGIKQLSEDPLNVFRTKYEKGQPIAGFVKKILEAKQRAIIKLSDDVEAMLPIRDVSKERIEKIGDVLKEGQELQLMITGIDERNRITVSLKAMDRQSEKEAMRKFRSEVKAEKDAKAKASSFGSMFREAMEDAQKDEQPAAEEAETAEPAAAEPPAAPAAAEDAAPAPAAEKPAAASAPDAPAVAEDKDK